MPERARGWAMAVGAEKPPSARPGERCKRQASVAQRHQPFCRRPRVYTENRFFSFIAIGKRRLRHRMRLIALSTMVCSDLANSSASFCNSKSKSGAPWRAGTAFHACTPVHEYGRLAHEQEPREGLARTPKGDRVGITSPTDTEFDRKDKDAHPSPRGLAAMYISVRTGPTAAACIRLTRERRAGSDCPHWTRCWRAASCRMRSTTSAISDEMRLGQRALSMAVRVRQTMRETM